MGSRLYVDNEKLDSNALSAPSKSKSAEFGSSAYYVKRLKQLSLFSFVFGALLFIIEVAIAEHRPIVSTMACRWVILGTSAVIYTFLNFVRIDIPTAKWIAVAYQLFLSFGVAGLEFGELANQGSVGVGISRVAVVAMIFPLFMQSSIRRTFVLSFLSACMIPLAFYVGQLTGAEIVPWSNLIWYLVSSFVICLASVIPTSCMNKFEESLEKAQMMGAYQFEDDGLIGKGGMGEVWKAKHAMLMRPTAIKIFNRDISLSDDPLERETAARRFRREAQAIAKLKSPHTVEIYDVGTCKASYSYYYAMELLEGMDLKKLIDTYGAISPSRSIFMLKQMCHSLNNAHENGMVHRDIKPANIFVCKYGSDYDFVKVLDFGLVKLLGKDQVDQTAVTQRNISTGTPAFIAPEMALGKDVDARTDIYALGCVAFWMMSGQLVFDADNSLQIALKHVQEEPPKLSDVSEFDIHPEIEALISKCLRKDPAERPQSVLEIYDVLKKVGLEYRAQRKGWNRKAARDWWLKHRPQTHVNKQETPIEVASL